MQFEARDARYTSRWFMIIGPHGDVLSYSSRELTFLAVSAHGVMAHANPVHKFPVYRYRAATEVRPPV